MGHELRKRKRGKICEDPQEPWKPTVLEIEVANYLHKKLNHLDGKMSGCKVNLFDGEEAVDILIESPWGKLKPNLKCSKSHIFTSHEAAVSFLKNLLEKNMFHRVLKLKKKQSVKKSDEIKKVSKGNAKKSEENKKTKSDKKSSSNTYLNLEKEQINGSTTGSPLEVHQKATKSASSDIKPKKTTDTSSVRFLFSSSKPIRVELAEDQIFTLDDPETVYMWIYEPPPSLKSWLAGSALLIFIILCCFFPIWPSPLRQGVYYLTVATLTFVAVLVLLALFRLLLYSSLLVASLGYLRFWLFPNLFEDCGFFESFKPIYSLQTVAASRASSKAQDEKSSKKRQKAPLQEASTGDSAKPSSLPESCKEVPLKEA